MQVFLLGSLLFGIGTAALIAVGRCRLGLDIALSSRYQTPALIFWASLVAFLAVTLDLTVKSRLIVGELALLILTLAAAGPLGAHGPWFCRATVHFGGGVEYRRA